MTVQFQYKITIFFLLAGLPIIWAQKKDSTIGTEVVNVVKPYTPTVSDAFKIKESPSLNDDENTKKENIKYDIFSFPVASTFTPAKGKAAGVDKAKKEVLYNNFATLGIGNYGNLNAELYVTEKLSSNDYVGGMFRHQSSQGGIKGIDLDDKFYNTRLDLMYGNKERDMSWNIDFGYQNQVYNWYGLSEDFVNFDPETIRRIDPKHTFNTVYAGGKIGLKDSFFNEASVLYKRFWDGDKSAENRLVIQPSLEFDILGEKIKTHFIIDYVGGEFDKDFYTGLTSIKYGFTNLGIQPGFVINRDDLSVNLGVGLFYSMDNENSENDFYVYPQVTASFNVVDDLMIAYAGAEGKLNQNSYSDFVYENPFVSPTLGIAPTNQQYDLYIGLKGKLASNISYNIKGSYLNEKNKALFKSNGFYETALNKEGYTYGNSLGVVYDDIKTISFFGELKLEVNKVIAFGVNGNFNSFSTGNQDEAWNLPELKVGADVDFKITEKWFAGANVFFVGERKDQFAFQDGLMTEVQLNTITLKSYFDANAHISYKYNDRLTAFLKANNIGNQAYQKWLNYPVQQFQIVVGASYKFDF